MLFFSNLLNAKVYDQADEVVGRVADVAIKMDGEKKYPPVAGVVVRAKKQDFFVTAVNVESYGKEELVLRKGLADVSEPVPQKNGHVFLRKTVLDKQIVDLEGARVVRVNDLELGMIGNTMSLVAIEIGPRGLLRRLGINKLDFLNIFKSKLLDWQNVHVVGDTVRLSLGAQNLVKLHPADIANIIEKLNLNQGSLLLQSLDQKTAAQVLEEIEPEIQKLLVQYLGPERAASVMDKMSMDELVDLIQMLPARKSQEIMSKLPADAKLTKMKKVLEYDEDTAGGLMSAEYITAGPDSTVEQVIEEIKRVSDSHRSVYFIYVVDDKGKFLGVASLRRLLVADKLRPLKELMRKKDKIQTVKPYYDVLRVASIMTKYNLMSVAVLEEGKLLGVVTVDDVMRHFLPKA
ncbi:magnesium transporter [Patescibacteria group bacterium]|nr:MAG: magnesium transporter [Patescibacteria group bacterium]